MDNVNTEYWCYFHKGGQHHMHAMYEKGQIFFPFVFRYSLSCGLDVDLHRCVFHGGY